MGSSILWKALTWPYPFLPSFLLCWKVNDSITEHPGNENQQWIYFSKHYLLESVERACSPYKYIWIFHFQNNWAEIRKKCSHPTVSCFPHPTLPTKWPGSMPKKMVTHSQVVKGKEYYYSKCNSIANHNSLLEPPTTDSSNFALTHKNIL